MKGIDYMTMFPILSVIGHGKAVMNNMFFISMNNLGSEMNSIEHLPHSV